MKCLKCQAENRDQVKFCEECGVRMEQQCPNCQAIIPLDKKFCGECGQDLSKPKEAPPIDYAAPQYYTPKHLADKILTTRSSIEGERKLVTVLFADVADYTAMSEKLDPEEVHQIMDGCFKILIDEIHKYEGTINQFTGDGVMALFGAPVAHEDHARRACQAALAIQKAMKEYGAKIEKETGKEFKMRIGVNSGSVIVGAIGDDLRMDYTAVGDTTNLAARMESLAQPGTVMVTGDTHRLVREYFELESLDRVEVKGKEEPQEAYQLIKPSDIGTRFEASVAKGLTKFVGRKNSMAALMEPYEKVRDGFGQVVGIVGEAGVGKSRLLLEFRKRIKDDFTYLEGRCIQFGSSMVFLPLLDILRKYCRIEEGEREYLVKKKLKGKIAGLDDNLTWTLSPFQDLLSVQVDDETWTNLEPQVKREKTFEALRDLFVRLSQERLLILCIEDLHWMDKSSEEFLGYLIDWIAGSRILLLLLYRPEYSHQWGSKTFYNRIGLDQLTTKSSAELVQAVLGQGKIVPELRELILGRAAGNPLFMEELTYTLLENGSIEKQDDRFVLSRKLSDIQVPDTIQGIIAARMDRLEENLKRTMQVASVIGRDFAFRILQSITDMREELKTCLLNLQGLEFIYEKQLFPELEYIFKHALTQEVAYNSLLLKRRKEIHENIGRAIVQIYAERLEEFYEMLAYHYSKSDNLEKAHHYLKQSGIKAIGHHSAWEAFRFYKEAINVLDRIPATDENKREQLEVIRLASIPSLYLGHPEDYMPILKHAEEISEELGDKRNLAWTYSMEARYYTVRADNQKALMYSKKSFNIALDIQDAEMMAQIAPSICASYMNPGYYLESADISFSVIDILEKTDRRSEYFGHPFNVYSLLCGYYGQSIGALGKFEEGMTSCEKGIRYALDLNDHATLGMCEFLFGTIFIFRGDWKQVMEHVQKSMNYFKDVNIIAFTGYCHGILGFAHTYFGDYDNGKRHLEKGLHFMKNTGIEFGKTFTYFWMGIYQYESGDLNEAERYFEESLSMSQQNNEKMNEGTSLYMLGATLGKMDSPNFEIAEKKILEGISVLEELKLKPVYSWGYYQLGELYSETGRKDDAREYLTKAKTNFSEMGMDFWLKRTREVLERL